MTTPGTVVQPGAVLLNIVPRTEPLVAEVAIKNEDVEFVQAGQNTKIKFMAYPFQKRTDRRGGRNRRSRCQRR